jgi:AraC-like DNA-binding protein
MSDTDKDMLEFLPVPLFDHRLGPAPSPTTFVRIIALIHDRRLRENLRKALTFCASLLCCDSERDLHRSLHEWPDAIAVIDLGERGNNSAALVGAIRRRFRALPVVGVVRWPVDARHILPATRAGLTDVFVLGHESMSDVLQRTAGESERVTASAIVLNALAPRLTDNAYSLVAHGLRVSMRRATAEEFAFATGLSTKTLQRRVARNGLGSPSELLAWCRILLAAQLLDDRTATTASVARELRFPSAAAFRRTLRGLTGLRPTELRTLGGLQYLAERFLATYAGQARDDAAEVG